MRALVVFLRLFPLVTSFVRDRRRWLWWGAPLARTEVFHQRRAERLVHTVSVLGPTFIKLAQVFAARADLVPEPYLAQLGTLADRVPPVPIAAVRRAIEEAYGRPVEAMFDQFEEAPIASASLGQVHRAFHEGRVVAVKVLRPGVEALVAEDLAAARSLVGLLERRFPRNIHVRALRPVIDEFAERIGEELDMRQEAAYAEEVRANFARETRILIPAMLLPLVRQRVLVSEFVEGRRVDRLEEWIGDGSIDPMRVVRTVMELYIQMMLIDGLFHADPHPGNLLVRQDGRVVLLDFGMVVRVPVELRRRLIRAVYAGIKRDVPALVDGFYGLGLVDPALADRPTIEALVGKLLGLAHEDLTGAEKAEILAGEVLKELHEWPIVLPREMVYFARTAALIEGLGARYDARFNPIIFAGPIALRMRPRVLAALGEGGVPGTPPGLDQLVANVGGLLGEVASVVWRAGREIAEIFRERLEPLAPPPLPPPLPLPPSSGTSLVPGD